MKVFLKIAGFILMLLVPSSLLASGGTSGPEVFGLRIEFIIFGLTLLGVAIFHNRTMYVALIGLATVLAIKYLFTPDFSFLSHIAGTPGEEGEWRILLNLFGLLLGFGILSLLFEHSGIPNKLPDILPNDWKGGFVLLFLIMVLATFLDSIASAMIGGAIALIVFKGKVHLGYLVAIVAASNAGGSGSVLGNTPTTMMWIDGVSPFDVLHAFIPSLVAFLIFGVIGSIQQDRYQRIQRNSSSGKKIDFGRVIIIVLILAGAIIANWTISFPAVGVWVAIFIGSLFRKMPWKVIPESMGGTIFLLALVTCASLMPVKDLPPASWQSSFILGFVSAVFDNIPLTKLCLEQGGYDWGMLSYAVGFGGSMLWFGSSAGVALSNMFPEAKSVVDYVKNGWHVVLAYIVGFFALLWILGWNPQAPHKNKNQEMILEQKR